jgi:tetratricopeptide (TPR) repeat protein
MMFAMRRATPAALVSALLLTAAEAGQLLARRETEYRAFRQHFAAGLYNEALPHAEQVVALTEAIDPAQPELASTLNNLGATHYRLGDYVAAETAYARALKLVEERQGAASKKLLAPLRGLALTYHAAGRNDAAVPLLERALAISRHADGLFNPGQQELLLPLTDAYVALGRWADAERQEQYSLRVSEHQFGVNDLRLLPALQRLAHWYEDTRRHQQARQTWQRVFLISADKAHQSFAGVITALRGIAHTFVLDYQFGPEVVEDPLARSGAVTLRSELAERDALGRRANTLAAADFHLDSQGREALEQALRIAERASPPSPQALFLVLLDLGDWNQVGEHADKALPFYLRAVPYAPAENGTPESPVNPLAYPRMLLYRQPGSAQRHKDQPAELVTEKFAIAEFTVTAEGKVRDVKIVEGDASDAQRSALAAALGKAIFRPRFADGKPVATDKVRFREVFRQSRH